MCHNQWQRSSYLHFGLHCCLGFYFGHFCLGIFFCFWPGKVQKRGMPFRQIAAGYLVHFSLDRCLLQWYCRGLRSQSAPFPQPYRSKHLSCVGNMPIGAISIGQMVCWMARAACSAFAISCFTESLRGQTKLSIPQPKEIFHICLSEGVKANIKWNSPAFFFPQVSFCWRSRGFWRPLKWQRKPPSWTVKNLMWFSAQLTCSGEEDTLNPYGHILFLWLNTYIPGQSINISVAHSSHIGSQLVVCKPKTWFVFTGLQSAKKIIYIYIEN